MLTLYLSMVRTEEDRDKVLFIYENYYGYMAYCASQVLKENEEGIKDAVHSAVIKIIENLDIIDLSDKRRAKNLCGVIAKNKAIDFCKAKGSQTLSLDENMCDAVNEDADPSDIVISKATYEAVIAAISKLDDIYRDVCLLRYVNGLKGNEIAYLLDIPLATANSRIARGKQILREILMKETGYEKSIEKRG